MSHYLAKLLKEPHIKDPTGKERDIHKHFTRYSKGHFDGPVFKVSLTKAKISVWCSYEYEDIALRLAVKNVKEDNINVKGNIIGSLDFSPLLEKLGFDKSWKPTKSKTQTVNYSTVFKTPIETQKDMFAQLVEKGIPYVNLLYSFTSEDKSVVLKTKTKPPRPSNKNPEDSGPAAKLKFCSLKIPKTQENIDWIINEAFGDFIDEIPEVWKTLLISNSYEITDLVFPPKDKKLSSRAFRLQTLRKGKINRVCDMDKNVQTKSFEFTG
ncbi:MAG: hypothetical protein ACTSVU_04040 [Promethearchaeota archaeon]